jgi:hypothetical protein
MATESSVVVALREVRRLELERQRREEEARQVALEEERARHAQQASIQYQGMEPYGNGNGNGHANGWANGHPNGDLHPESYAHPHPMRRTSEVVPLAANGGYADSQGFVHVPGAVWEAPAQQPPKGRSSFKAVVVTMVLCGGAAFAGYMKLNADHAQQLSLMREEQQKASDARAETVAARSKVEQELKVKVTELEGKLAAAQAKASSAAVALAAVAGAAKPAAEGGPKVAALGGHGKARLGAWKGRNARIAAAKARAAAAAAAAAPKADPFAPAPAKAPKLVKKKAVSDDPLGGLKL